MRWADVYVPHVSPASMSPASMRRCPRALSPGARCDGPTSTSACWPTVLPSGIVALRGRLAVGVHPPARSLHPLTEAPLDLASTQDFGYQAEARRSEVTVTNPPVEATVTRASLREYADRRPSGRVRKR